MIMHVRNGIIEFNNIFRKKQTLTYIFRWLSIGPTTGNVIPDCAKLCVSYNNNISTSDTNNINSNNNNNPTQTNQTKTYQA